MARSMGRTDGHISPSMRRPVLSRWSNSWMHSLSDSTSRNSASSSNDLAQFVQRALERPAISQIETYRELVPLETFVSLHTPGAKLLYCRSPFLCALNTSN